ncbi:LacZ Beta-galactosidase/beta-glucuronidase [Candidatus Nanopelagicaceae bacterium]
MKVQREKVSQGFSLDIETPQGQKKFPASVPGSIHTDLIAAGVIGDIRVDGTEAEQEWIRNADSAYSAQIPAQSGGGKYELKFDGLDTLATVSVNGAVKLRSENMHRAYVVDISDVASSAMDLKVEFKAPLPEALKRQDDMGRYPNPYDMPYNYFRKMACSFGWDWGPITVTSGIWKPIWLTKWDEGILDEVGIVADVVDGVPQLRVRTVGRGVESAVSVRISGHGKEKSFKTTLGSDEVIACEGFELWHPRGFGEATMYSVEVSLFNSAGIVIDEVTKRVGFRHVSLDQSNFGDRQMFAICVNGERVWAKGVNWIPDDPFPHRVTKEQYAQKIQDLYSVEVNAIRVWGGGIYESDDFYDLCDELGIIVWQDFLFACAAYPETPAMFAEVADEAHQAITRLGSHASLVMWCGGNECIEGFQYWGWQEPLAGKAWGLNFYLDTLPAALAAFDGSRPYIPGSPFSTLKEDVKDFSSGTNHIWDVWNETGYQRYEEYSPSFSAEFGYNGPGSWRTLTKAIGKSNLDSADSHLATHQKAFFGMDKVANGLVREFSKEFTLGPAWYFAAQLVQARAVEVGLKHFRSQYETCSGSVLWQYNDMWPAISWAVLDSASSRKLSWYAMREAYRPQVLHFSGPMRKLILINDTSDNWSDALKVHLIGKSGEVLESSSREVSLEPRSQANFDLSDLFDTANISEIDGYLVAELGDIRSARRILDAAVNQVCAHNVDIQERVVGNQVQVHIDAKCFIHELSLLPELVALDRVTVSAEGITLLPGESIDLVIECSHSEDAKKVASKVEEITWSLNRLMN